MRTTHHCGTLTTRQLADIVRVCITEREFTPPLMVVAITACGLVRVLSVGVDGGMTIVAKHTPENQSDCRRFSPMNVLVVDRQGKGVRLAGNESLPPRSH